MSTQIDLTTIDGVTAEMIADCPQPCIEMLRAITDHFTARIEELEENIGDHQRYFILRDVVTSTTDLDAETIDRLVEERMEEEEE